MEGGRFQRQRRGGDGRRAGVRADIRGVRPAPHRAGAAKPPGRRHRDVGPVPLPHSGGRRVLLEGRAVAYRHRGGHAVPHRVDTALGGSRGRPDRGDRRAGRFGRRPLRAEVAQRRAPRCVPGPGGGSPEAPAARVRGRRAGRGGGERDGGRQRRPGPRPLQYLPGKQSRVRGSPGECTGERRAARACRRSPARSRDLGAFRRRGLRAGVHGGPRRLRGGRRGACRAGRALLAAGNGHRPGFGHAARIG